MNTRTRRGFVFASAIAAFAGTGALAQNPHAHHDASTPAPQECSVPAGTPPIVPVASEIPFDLAYIDTMIPHHQSVIALSEAAQGALKDERLQKIAQAVLDTQPEEIDQLQTFRTEWYPEADAEPSHDTLMEMMQITMAAPSGCSSNDDHMNMMDATWLVASFKDSGDKDLSFIDLVVPHHQMAVRQSTVGMELAEHEELRELCTEVVKAQSAEIEELQAIRTELLK